MANNGNNTERLTPRQKRAITALLASKDVKAAAEAANIGERTLYRWMKQDHFRAALKSAENELFSEITRRLISGQNAALDVLETIMNGAEKDSDQRLAAVNWLEFSARFQELNSIQERLTELESIVFKQTNGKAR